MINIKLVKKQEKRSNASIFLFFCLLKFYLDLIVREKKSAIMQCVKTIGTERDTHAKENFKRFPADNCFFNFIRNV